MRELVEKLRASAIRCRELEKTATDRDAARALAEVAEEIETTLPILEESLTRQET